MIEVHFGCLFSGASLQALIALYLERGAFTVGNKEQDAVALWEAMRREVATAPSPFPAGLAGAGTAAKRRYRRCRARSHAD